MPIIIRKFTVIHRKVQIEYDRRFTGLLDFTMIIMSGQLCDLLLNGANAGQLVKKNDRCESTFVICSSKLKAGIFVLKIIAQNVCCFKA